MMVGCSVRIVKWALLALFLLLAPRLLRKARRKGKKAVHRAPRKARKLRRAARRSIRRRRRELPL